jgi:hypothetical protein
VANALIWEFSPPRSAEEKEFAVAYFRQLHFVQGFPSILHQLKERFPLRVEMDKAIFKVMGFSKDETDKILKSLYPALANEIEKLKTLMEG